MKKFKKILVSVVLSMTMLCSLPMTVSAATPSATYKWYSWSNYGTNSNAVVRRWTLTSNVYETSHASVPFFYMSTRASQDYDIMYDSIYIKNTLFTDGSSNYPYAKTVYDKYDYTFTSNQVGGISATHAQGQVIAKHTTYGTLNTKSKYIEW